MYGAVEKNDEIIFKMYFMGGNNLIAIGDRNITSISAAGVEEGSVEVTNEIMGVGLCGNKIAMIYGEELSDKEGELPGTIVFVSSGGKLSTGDSAEVCLLYTSIHTFINMQEAAPREKNWRC